LWKSIPKSATVNPAQVRSLFENSNPSAASYAFIHAINGRKVGEYCTPSARRVSSFPAWPDVAAGQFSRVLTIRIEISRFGAILNLIRRKMLRKVLVDTRRAKLNGARDP
jgi:hypothetical protein